MEDIWDSIFGQGRNLTALQVGVRSLLMFFVALAMLRLGGIRIFGKKSAFDQTVMIMLGAILSRGIMGASPFGTTITAGVVIVGIHRLIAWVCTKNKMISSILNGKPVTLYKDGKLIPGNLNRCSLSEDDLMSSLRTSTGKKYLHEVEEARMETSGKISFIVKQSFLE